VIHRSILFAALILPLASCGSKPTVNEKNASVEEVSQKVSEATKAEGFIRPGKWQSTVNIEQMTMPGMPPQAAEQMKKMLAQTQTTETCLTPEEAKQPRAKFFGGNDQCRYDHFKMGRGKIDAEMHCTQNGSTQVMEMNGTYSGEAYTMQMTSTMEGGQSAANVSMKIKVDAKRVGECTAKES
jgi:hypothetical protein